MFSRTMEKILICGAGITGAVTASILRKELPEKCKLVIWEKSKKIGGRMNTRRCKSDPQCSVDVGAQYITSLPDNFAKNKIYYDELLSSGILVPRWCDYEGERTFPDGTHHFVAPRGMDSIVTHFLHKSGVEVRLEQELLSVNQDGRHYRCSTQTGTEELFDGVLLTCPVPQILQIEGAVRLALDCQPEIKKRLECVEYSSRFALGLYYKPGTQIDVPWVARYVKGDPIIVFIAVDSKKRGQDIGDIGPSILVHAGVPFSLHHLEADADTVCRDHVLPRVGELIPGLPPPIDVICHKWTYSQVFKPYSDRPGAVMLHDQPMLLCGGDAFIDSGFDNCLQSARTLAELVTRKSVL